MSRFVLLSTFAGLCAVTIGCSAASETVVEDVPSADVPTYSSAQPVAPDAGPATSPAAAERDPPKPRLAGFSPPFPDRLEMFEPPKRAQGTVRRDEEHDETVELKGFVNVDEPRVVLSIDGVISPIGEGGEKYGVQVISIQPPTVVLQRGRDRWTATLE